MCKYLFLQICRNRYYWFQSTHLLSVSHLYSGTRLDVYAVDVIWTRPLKSMKNWGILRSGCPWHKRIRYILKTYFCQFIKWCFCVVQQGLWFKHTHTFVFWGILHTHKKQTYFVFCFISKSDDKTAHFAFREIFISEQLWYTFLTLWFKRDAVMIYRFNNS